MALYLIRHALAGSPLADAVQNRRRPLEPGGLVQAEAIAVELASKPIKRILSSPARRCRSTVAPLAEKLGLETEVVKELGEAASSAGAVDLLHSLAERSGDSVLASHGDVIPAVMRRLARSGLDIDTNRRCEKASIWELAVADGKIKGGLYRRPRTFGAGIPA